MKKLILISLILGYNTYLLAQLKFVNTQSSNHQNEFNSNLDKASLLNDKTSKYKFGLKGFAISPKAGAYKILRRLKKRTSSSEFDSFLFGTTVGVELNVFNEKLIHSVDYYQIREFLILGSENREVYNQIAFMIGGYTKHDFFRLQYQGGIAPVWGLKRTGKVLEYRNSGKWLDFTPNLLERKPFFAPGLAFKVGFKVMPLPFLALGLDFQANINTYNQMFTPMPLINIEIGRIRDRWEYN